MSERTKVPDGVLVLDPACSARMCWFDKADARCLFSDIRRETLITDTRPGRSPTVIDPDMIADFTDLPFEDESFYHVLLDAPHTLNMAENTRTVKKYGTLHDDWREVLSKGFAECFRVLKPGGTLVFKWSSIHIPLKQILALTPEKPLYGTRSGKQSHTYWICFVKNL